MIILVVTREQVELEPGEEIEVDGDIELTNQNWPKQELNNTAFYRQKTLWVLATRTT